MKYIKFLFFVLLFTGCSTDEFLNVKPANLLIPQTLEDFRLLLDDQYTMNSFPVSAFYSDDDIHLTTARLELLSPWRGNLYQWKKNIYDSQQDVRDWNNPYKAIYVANTVLSQLNSSHTGTERNTIEGEALFYRAVHHYNLVSLFAKAYDPNTAATDLGIPLRLNTNIESAITRNSIQEVMNQVIEDLKQAVTLLPELPSIITRPSKASAYGFLARINLNMGNYEAAWTAADESLKIKNELIDFNTLEDSPMQAPTAFVPVHIKPIITTENSEVSFVAYSDHINANIFFFTNPELVKLYNSNDRRRIVYFDTSATIDSTFPVFAGNYFTETNGGSSDPSPFVGISTNEMYLIRAECSARSNAISNAMNDLNTLLEQRYVTGTFVDLTANNKDEALDIILLERRKELAFRGLRWHDLKRLNKDPNRQKTLQRIVNGEIFSLQPNGLRYVLPIPLEEIRRSGIQQNKR